MDLVTVRYMTMTSRYEESPLHFGSTDVDVVRRDVTVTCYDRAGRAHDLEIEFLFDPADPYAVTLAFPSQRTAIPWSFARSLLSRGLTDPVGHGDVQVWPGLADDGRAVVGVRLSSPDGELIFEVLSSQVYSFLSATFSRVPVGSESAHLDVDGLLTRLLSD